MNTSELTTIPLELIQESPTNPKARISGPMFEELVRSIQTHGVLTPVLVRPRDGNPPFELVAGSRRLAAARAALLKAVPANVRGMSDAEALELQLIENLQRADLHPLEEAEGYHQLGRQPGYDVAKIAERVGRSVAYVYDRLKLLQLTPDAAAAFRDDRFTTAHAIILARLKPAEQKRALSETDALFTSERDLFGNWRDRHGGSSRGAQKARSVREFSDWVNRSIRFDAKAPDPMLFPETAQALEGANKVVAITHENYIPPEARDGKTFGPKSWKRADGTPKHRACEYSVLGFIAAGRDRGASFQVCVRKDKCAVHWPEQARAAKKRAAAQPRGDGKKLVGNTPIPAPQKADPPELLAQIEKAVDQAVDGYHARIVVKVRKMPLQDFLRMLIVASDWNSVDALNTLAGTKVNNSTLAKWAKSAALPDLMVALVNMDDDRLLDDLAGAKLDTVRDAAGAKVRAEWTAKSAAAKPSKATRKKAAKKRAARRAS